MRNRRGEQRGLADAGLPAQHEHPAPRRPGAVETARRRDPSTIDDLTAQELQIARFVAGGASNREVAAQLFLSPRTIDFHLRNVYAKLGIASRHDLAAFDLGDGLVPAKEPVAHPARG